VIEPDKETLQRLQLEAALGGRAVDFQIDNDHFIKIFPNGKRQWFVILPDTEHSIGGRRIVLHRLDGPAIEEPGKVPIWYRNGALCNPDGTEILSADALVVSFDSVVARDQERGRTTVLHPDFLKSVIVEAK